MTHDNDASNIRTRTSVAELIGPVDPGYFDFGYVNEYAVTIRTIGRRAISDIIEIGRRLTWCKEQIPHGYWLPWLEEQFNWSERTAQNFMQMHAASLKSAKFADLPLPISCLYLLASHKTPDEVRYEVMAQAKRGERLKFADVKKKIAIAKHAPPRRRRASRATKAAADRAERRSEEQRRRAGTNGNAPTISDTAADPIQEPCADCAAREERWQRSLGNLAGDAVSLSAFWTREFGDWQTFAVTSDLATLAEQAAEAWAQVASDLTNRCRRAPEPGDGGIPGFLRRAAT